MKTFRMLLLALALAPALAAQHDTPLRCAAPEYRQFDFWIGEWEVYQGEKFAGKNRIERVLDGCVLMENWEGVGGSRGHSFNLYNVRSGEWEQTWVDNAGGVIHFHGNFSDGVMAMTAESTGRDGKPVYYKLTFFDHADGTVRQLWEASRDRESWKVLFDGLYRRVKE